MRGKRGWIRIVEAFIAVLLISGTLLIVINKGYIGKKDISQKVYDAELAILKEIEMDEGLRKEILRAEEGVIPTGVSSRIEQRIPNYLDCQAKICKLNDICVLDLSAEAEDRDVYATPIAIAATSDRYNPRQLKLFCWVK